METLLLTASQIQELLNPIDLFQEMEAAFKSYSLGEKSIFQRAHAKLKVPGTSAMILFPGRLENIPAYTIKNHSKFPQESPAINGVVHLHDIETGKLLAIMDSTYITAVRTGLSGAIGAKWLAHKDAEEVAIIGAGTQGKMQLQLLSHVRNFSKVSVYDTSIDQACRFMDEMKTVVKAELTLCESPEEAVSDADIIVTATWSEEPFLFSKMIKPGAHITALGADQPNKAELSGELIQQSLFFCDDRKLAVEMGAIGAVGLTSAAIHGEIGELLGGKTIGRTTDEQITIYGAVGLAFQDLAAVWYVYRKAQKLCVGRKIDFLS